MDVPLVFMTSARQTSARMCSDCLSPLQLCGGACAVVAWQGSFVGQGDSSRDGLGVDNPAEAL